MDLLLTHGEAKNKAMIFKEEYFHEVKDFVVSNDNGKLNSDDQPPKTVYIAPKTQDIAPETEDDTPDYDDQTPESDDKTPENDKQTLKRKK